jgi:hypothetical protein
LVVALTVPPGGILTARKRSVVDVWTLVERDHRELDLALSAIVDGSSADLRDTLDALRIGFAAHAEAHARAICEPFATLRVARRPGEAGTCDVATTAYLPTHLAALLHELEAAHRSQERQLSRLAIASITEWPARARFLRDDLLRHHEFERTWCVPMLRARVPAYDQLAARYATERLRALAWTWRSEATEARGA